MPEQPLPLFEDDCLLRELRPVARVPQGALIERVFSQPTEDGLGI